MARKHRLWSPYHYFHIVMRGNNRQTIFLHHTDYQAFFALWSTPTKSINFQLLHFVLCQTIITYCSIPLLFLIAKLWR